MVCVKISGPKKKKNLQHWDDYDDDEYLDIENDDYDYDEHYNYSEHDESADYDDYYDRYLWKIIFSLNKWEDYSLGVIPNLDDFILV